MDRPALGRLLNDIDAGRIDTIVVYKIDRLTRSLADFARIVERLDKADASFVSVTQAFNTTTSMGRLTLNVLLSFAQFEREVTGERIRDKIAASKKKGMWMGGNLPLGYDAPTDPTTRQLVPNIEEAEQVRSIFRMYLELGSAPLQRGRSGSGSAILRRVKAETLDEAVRGSVATCLDRPEADLGALLPQIRRVEVTQEALHISLDQTGLPAEARRRLARAAPSGILTVPIRCKSRGGRVWAPATEDGRRGRKDPALIKSLRKAHRIASAVGWRTRGATDIAEAPANAYDRKLCRLAFLAPDIQRAILEGRQPPDLTLDQLLHQPISPCWRTQRIKLGFASIP